MKIEKGSGSTESIIMLAILGIILAIAGPGLGKVGISVLVSFWIVLWISQSIIVNRTGLMSDKIETMFMWIFWGGNIVAVFAGIFLPR